MNCGITGHTGALGQEFIKNNKNIKFIKFHGDLTNKKEVEFWVKKNTFNIFLHFAAVVPTKFVNENYLYTKKVNIDGSKNLINSLYKYNKETLEWFFFSSTSHVYNFKKKKITEKDKVSPISKYGKTKLLAERLLLKKNFNICVGRIFSFTHRSHNNQYLIPSLYKKINNSKNKKIKLDNLNHNRDFLDLSDICYAITTLMKKRKVGIYNICSSKKINLKVIAMYIARKRKILCEFNDKTFKSTNHIGDNKKLLRLGWKPKKNLKNLYKINFKGL
jgi:nucleoside-diphosphate-sugar epimerase